MRDRPADFDRLFHALGDPTRRAILDRLVERPASVSNLAEPLGITLTAVMQHLEILEAANLVRTEKLGRVRTSRIETAGFRASSSGFATIALPGNGSWIASERCLMKTVRLDEDDENG